MRRTELKNGRRTANINYKYLFYCEKKRVVKILIPTMTYKNNYFNHPLKGSLLSAYGVN